jgi:hypothetical protein
MIAYYIHHVGQGHTQRARAVIEHLPGQVTALSSLPAPPGWRHDWIVLPRDDDGASPVDPTAGGLLHWVPRHHRGLQSRMAVLTDWLAEHDPAVLVSDLSMEVTILARLIGIPVVTVALPGAREDPAHQLGYGLSDAILAPWPRLDADMCPGLEPHASKVHHVGGLSRFDGRPAIVRGAAHPGIVLSISGSGGEVRAPVRRPVTPGWHWTTRGPGHWVNDPWPDLCAADVIVAHCGLGVLAEIAAAKRPAVLIPEPRPHDEQLHTARAIAAAGLATVLDREPENADWPRILAETARSDGATWTAWSDGRAARRAAVVITDVAAR